MLSHYQRHQRHTIKGTVLSDSCDGDGDSEDGEGDEDEEEEINRATTKKLGNEEKHPPPALARSNSARWRVTALGYASQYTIYDDI